MQYENKNSGFTLIELIVVITIISLMLVFALPNFQSFITDSSKKTSRWIILTVKFLKQSAIHEQKLYTLHIGIDQNKMWYTDEGEPEEENSKDLEDEIEKSAFEETESPIKGEYKLPKDFKILDVEYPGDDKVSSGEAALDFYKKGYSDKAIIHIEDEDDNQYSYMIEPFLLRVKMVKDYISFEE